MDITVTNNPNQNNNNVLSDGTFRVAKLNNDTKRPHIANYWVLNMSKLKEESQEVVETVGSRGHSYDVILGRLGMTNEVYEHYSNINGFRKLKVNKIVQDKTLKVYENSTKIEPEKPMVMQEEEVKQEFKAPEEPVNELPKANDLPDTRMSRLEKTGEIPRVNDTRNAMDSYRDALNYQGQVEERPSLSRVERHIGNDDYSGMDTHPEKVQVGKETEALNRIANFSPFSQNGNMKENTDLQDAYDRFAASEKKKKDSRDTVMRLEQQIAEVKGLLEEKHKKEIADLNARTKANEDETLGYTMHSEDLRAQLEELRNQLNSGGMRR